MENRNIRTFESQYIFKNKKVLLSIISALSWDFLGGLDACASDTCALDACATFYSPLSESTCKYYFRFRIYLKLSLLDTNILAGIIGNIYKGLIKDSNLLVRYSIPSLVATLHEPTIITVYPRIRIRIYPADNLWWNYARYYVCQEDKGTGTNTWIPIYRRSNTHAVWTPFSLDDILLLA